MTLTWVPPTENTDGTPLTDLSGYIILYGPGVGMLDQTITLTNPGLTTYVIDGLTLGTPYSFEMEATASDGTVSAPTAPVSATP